jgi:hypothetical protein
MYIKFELFRVLPVLLYFISFAYAIVFWNVGWMMMIAGLALNGAIWRLVNPLTQKYLPKLSVRPNKSQCYFFHQKTLTEASGLPSGHCQAAAFFSMWLVIMAIVYRAPTPVLVSAVCVGVVVTVGMILSRAYEYRCHTLLQANVGSAIGIVTALAMWPILAKFN